jgi:acyl-CoA thioesterase FadM
MHEDDYTIVEDVVAPGEAGAHHHLVDFETQELLSKLWSKYVAMAGDGVPAGDVVPAPKRITTVLESECFAGQKLQRGIKAVARTRRTYTLQAALWHADDGRMVVTSEIVTVAADRSTGSAVEIPAGFWENVERIEGREIPITERPAT